MYSLRRTAAYVAKVKRSKNYTLLKRFLGTWMHCPRKIVGTQLPCNNNCVKATLVSPRTHQKKPRSFLVGLDVIVMVPVTMFYSMFMVSIECGQFCIFWSSRFEVYTVILGNCQANGIFGIDPYDYNFSHAVIYNLIQSNSLHAACKFFINLFCVAL